MMNEMNEKNVPLEDQQVENVSGGYVSTDHYTFTRLSTPMTCGICGGKIYSFTANNYGPNRVLKSVTYHCDGNGSHPPHDIVETY